MDDFEVGMAREFEALLDIVKQRRDKMETPLMNQEMMGRLFALGAADSLLWRALARTKGDTFYQ